MARQRDDAHLRITVTREYDVPPHRVWSAWADPGQVARWWACARSTARVEAFDFREGGRWRCVVILPDGTQRAQGGTFGEIVPHERIVRTERIAGGGEAPDAYVAAAEFADLNGRTRLTVTHSHPTAENRRRHEALGAVAELETRLDCLERHLTRNGGPPVPDP